ncbi:hypothetical protein G7046_g4778 [Stylonectria norvegica]|nr:hypothetical protein G7046_g4778 [Stylonectria norvegica]
MPAQSTYLGTYYSSNFNSQLIQAHNSRLTMAPVRRYLRISKYSVLECRIYLDNPALAQSWLLNPRSPMLPRIIESIRPLVLPKLREEKERSKKKSTKKKTIKDVVIQDDFEISMFLTETSTRHSLVAKSKHFREKLPGRMESNSTKLIGETDNVAVDVDAESNVPVLREEDDDDLGLTDIPLANHLRRSKRPRRMPDQNDEFDLSDGDETASAIEIDSDTELPPHKRPRGRVGSDADALIQDEGDDKKKLAMDVSYEGFAIYGRVLCLVVKKRDTGKVTQPGNSAAAGAGASGGSDSGWGGRSMSIGPDDAFEHSETGSHTLSDGPCRYTRSKEMSHETFQLQQQSLRRFCHAVPILRQQKNQWHGLGARKVGSSYEWRLQSRARQAGADTRSNSEG